MKKTIKMLLHKETRQALFEVWAERIRRWWDTHRCAVSRTAATNLVMERDMLREQLEKLEDQDSIEIEKLTQENDYLKDELAYEHMRNKRLESEIQTVRDRDYKDIYPGLQAENKQLREKIDELIKKLEEGEADAVPTETTSEDS